MAETAHPPTPMDVLEEHVDEFELDTVRSARERIESYDGWQYAEHSPSVVAAAAVWLESDLRQPEVATRFDVSAASIRNATTSMGVDRDHRVKRGDTRQWDLHGGDDGAE